MGGLLGRVLNSKNPKKTYAWLVAGVIGFNLPLILGGGASWLAARHDCTLNAAAAHPCVIWGADRGEALYSAFMSPIYYILTLPFAICCVIAFVVLGIRDLSEIVRNKIK